LRFDPAKEGDPEIAAEVPFSRCWLLAAQDCLWIISAMGTARLASGGLEQIDTAGLGEISRPFLWGVSPAILVRDWEGLRLRRLLHNAWTVEPLPASLPEILTRTSPTDVQALAIGSELWIFLQRESVVCSWRSTSPPGSDWQSVSGTSGDWRAFEKEGRPLVATWSRVGSTERLAVYEGSGDSWMTVLDLPAGSWDPNTLFTWPGPGAFWQVSESFPGAYRIREIRSGRVERTFKVGHAFPFAPQKFFGTFMILPLVIAGLLAVFIWGQARRHRKAIYRVKGAEAPFASILRRAIASFVDGIVMGGPLMAASMLWMSNMDFLEFEEPRQLIRFFAIALIGGAWSLVAAVVFTWTEGRWGVTPGRWLAGIRVMGVDLRPCGFGRAFIRRILGIFVDFQFNGMVGILVLAFTERFQRLGDLVAKTVVVRAGTLAPPG
ncbi:MAG TPA: RDD family protein, partial [Planctomycetota bacterium]|nr:RDD family protein [Planctomycetota bacterium]